MIITFIVLIAVLSRFVVHIPNFAPITALAIFSAAYMPAKKAVGITLAARLISDIFLGFFSWPLMIAVYASHLIGILFGLWIKHSASKQSQWMKIFASSLGASIIFFLVTNFAFLYSMYPHTISGILAAYINGLQFLKGTLLGDLFYSIMLFGAMELAAYYRLSPTTSAGPKAVGSSLA